MKDNIHNIPVGFLLERTTRVVKLGFHRCFKNMNIDLTPEQWVMMDVLYQQNDQSQKELAAKSFKDAPTISRIINVLEKKQWVERRIVLKDRRKYTIHQTDLGRKITEQLLDEVKKIREQGWAGLSADDYEEFTRILNKVFDNYEK